MLTYAPPVAIPRNAPRRSWLADQLRRQSGPGRFAALLRELAPRTWTRLQGAPLKEIYLALLGHVGTLFPVYDLVIEEYFDEEMLEAGGDETDVAQALLTQGIPVETFGRDYYDDYAPIQETESAARALCMAIYIRTSEPTDPILWREFQALTPCADLLTPWLEAKPLRALSAGFAKPPYGRAWHKPWDALGDLFDHAHNATGFTFLDYSDLMMLEGGYPPWDLETIRGLAREWQRAKPVWGRLNALQDHLDGDPKKQLPLLAGALLGDTATRQALTRPARTKTLTKVFDA